jgi:signal transduction histidine kinase
MASSVDWLTQLLQDILEILALDSGKGVEAWTTVSLPDIVRDVIDRHRSRAQEKGLRMEAVPASPDVPPALGDRARILQALGELVENAIVFTPAGGQITLLVAEPEAGWVTVAVQDTGPGIADEELPHLFDRFFRGRLAESGHTAGVGLGLPIAQRIAEAHGGRIMVESALEQGSTFTLWLRPMKESA